MQKIFTNNCKINNDDFNRSVVPDILKLVMISKSFFISNYKLKLTRLKNCKKTAIIIKKKMKFLQIGNTRWIKKL